MKRIAGHLMLSMLLAATIAVAIGGSATAQRTGTRLDRSAGAVKTVSRLDAKSAIIAANTYAQCVARREGNGMRKALDLPFTSSEQTKAMARQGDYFDTCLGDSIDFDTLVLTPILKAGGAAEWFVKTELKDVDLLPLKGMPDEVIQQTDYRARTAFEDLGLCVLRQAPEKVRPFLETRPTSIEERAAFQAIAPSVGPCVTEGSKLELNVPNLRAILAYAAYRAASKLGAAGA